MYRLALALVLGLPSAFAAVAAPNPLNLAALLANKTYFGSASDNANEFNNTLYTSILSQFATFGQLTPANAMKWELTEPVQNMFTFDGADQLVDFAEANNQIVRGHNFVWHNQLPDWLTNPAVNWTVDTLTPVLENHILTLGGRYAGKIFAWDVVNEGINDDGTFRDTMWLETFGPSYYALAFNIAHQADPNARLYVNDFNVEGEGPKATAYLNLIQSLQAQNVPIHGIGFQSHFIVGGVPPTLQANMEAFAALGIEVAITELDIRMTLPSNDTLVAQQEQDYLTVVQACANVPACVGITLWDYTDKFSWIPGTFAGMGDACPWDENIQAKPGVISAIEMGLIGETL